MPTWGRVENGRRRRGLTALGAGGIGAAVALGATTASNPWHLVYLGPRYIVPVLAVVLAGGVGLLWFARVRSVGLRIAGLAGLSLALVAFLLLGATVADLTKPWLRERIDSPRNDVAVELRTTHNTWDVWLRADRGLLSREHHVADIGMGDSAPPDVDVLFPAADEVAITHEGTVVYRARFDPGDLDVRRETCRPFSSPPLRVGCL